MLLVFGQVVVLVLVLIVGVGVTKALSLPTGLMHRRPLRIQRRLPGSAIESYLPACTVVWQAEQVAKSSP